MSEPQKTTRAFTAKIFFISPDAKIFSLKDLRDSHIPLSPQILERVRLTRKILSKKDLQDRNPGLTRRLRSVPLQ